MALSTQPSFPQQKVRNGCINCGIDGPRPNDPATIDLGYTVDFEGAVVMCWECACELARLVGYVSPNKALDLQAEIESLHANILMRESLVDIGLDIMKVTQNLQSAVEPLTQPQVRYVYVAEKIDA